MAGAVMNDLVFEHTAWASLAEFDSHRHLTPLLEPLGSWDGI